MLSPGIFLFFFFLIFFLFVFYLYGVALVDVSGFLSFFLFSLPISWQRFDTAFCYFIFAAAFHLGLPANHAVQPSSGSLFLFLGFIFQRFPFCLP